MSAQNIAAPEHVAAAGDSASKPFTYAEQMPMFPGGEDGLRVFLKNNIYYPAYEQKNNIQGRVVLQFVITEDGSVADVRVIKSVSPGIDAEAIRVVKLLPKFKPGYIQGRPVKVYYVLPVQFHLADTKQLYNSGNQDGTDPEFPGGKKKLLRFVKEQIRYPEESLKNKIQGIVMLRFMVNHDGSISQIVVTDSVSKDLDAEAVRVAKLLPNFKPGHIHGRPVNATYNLPVEFKLTKR